MPTKMRPTNAMAFIDSHTEGEPTRVVFDGIPDLGVTSIAERSRALRESHGWLRAAIVDEPRGYPALVGALLLPPSPDFVPTLAPRAAAAVVYVNNVSTLPMCVHASIGVARTLAQLGRAPEGVWPEPLALETPAGEVAVRIETDGWITVTNVPAYRSRAAVAVETSRGTVRGDVAWGGNWFFIVEEPPVPVAAEHIPALTELCLEIRAALDAAGVRGDQGEFIDHVQLCGPSTGTSPSADSRNFVLCPGGEYDRSACGTGTSARMACLHADGRLGPGQRWVQEGITGSCFVGSVEPCEALAPGCGAPCVRPQVRGRAWVTAEGKLLFDPRDDRHGRPTRTPPEVQR
ncbi:hypothetical protein PPSIR1_14150 [Plesiocystis pacifica SIR-1]|uniref:Proline racemase n=1 Tax=Plesiocystis pacifica SIR-1 TaxID=391625 RepID=A6G915_9BACT|nr:proline racemase family protein [Plesiocystis pacifica]EDM77701.1 hypothetical protein PPSIR1_14150 [Plesiocystis pacifica SIR-1]